MAGSLVAQGQRGMRSKLYVIVRPITWVLENSQTSRRLWRLGALKQAVSENDIQGTQTILPAHFFPLCVRPCIICDSDLLNSAAKFGEFCDQFSIDSKSILGNGYAASQRCSKCFVPGL